MKELITANGYKILLDEEDYHYFNQFYWWTKEEEYTYRSGNICLHIEIMKRHNLYEDGKEVDHKDRNRLNCQKYNLRMGTKSQNAMNKGKNPKGTSQYKGVSWCQRDRRWVAQIKINRIQKHIGNFRSEVDAAKAYNDAAKMYFGEFAALNEIKKHDSVA